MKIKIIAAMVAVAAVSQAGLLDWTANTWGSANASVDGVTLVDGWFVGLYSAADLWAGDKTPEDLLTNVEFTTLNIITTGPAFSHYYGIDGKSIDIANNIPVFSVILNAATTEAATQYLVIDSATFNSGSAAPPATANAYTLAAPVGTWQNVVPEPATIGLFGLGALSAWIVRRNKMKATEEA